MVALMVALLVQKTMGVYRSSEDVGHRSMNSSLGYGEPKAVKEEVEEKAGRSMENIQMEGVFFWENHL